MKVNHAEYLLKVGEEHRKEYGQFFTHPLVAKFMVEWVLNSEHKTLFDPAFGLGAFLTPIANDREIKFSGCEIDPEIIKYWKCSTGEKRVNLIQDDYLQIWGNTYNNIVCNPPYMRFQKFVGRDSIMKTFRERLGFNVSGYTNTASAFLLKSLFELKKTGRLAYVMPLEFLNSGYGTLVKKRLIESGHLVAIIKLECEREVFPDAITTVGIVLYDASRRYTCVDFHVAKSVYYLDKLLDETPNTSIQLNQLEPSEKWLPYFSTNRIVVKNELTVPLSIYGQFKRGISTGVNEFFVLKLSQAKALGIDYPEIVPCITRSSQLKKILFGVNEYERLLYDDCPVLLFSAAKSHSRQAASYIKVGEIKGYNKRYITRNRHPWYKTEYREPSQLLLGVFSRGGYKLIRNESKALNLTCFHGFQPNIFGTKYQDHLFLYLASSPGRDLLSLSNRKYGDGLEKFEPNDLNKALVPSQKVLDGLSDSDVENAVQYTKEYDHTPDWINNYFEQLKCSKKTGCRKPSAADDYQENSLYG